MELPDGVVDVRKVKTAGGGEGGRAHLTWVIAYSERIEVGSPRHEAIRQFAGALKAPRNMDHSVMLLPVISRESREAQAPAPAKAAPKVRAKPRAKVRVAKAGVKAGAKSRSKTRAKVAAAKSRSRAVAKSPTRKPARRPRRAKR